MEHILETYAKLHV